MAIEAAHATTTSGARAETPLNLMTTYAENGEVDLIMIGDRIVLFACQETPCGCDRVHSRKLTLQLTRRDAADLRRKIDCLLRDSTRSGQWSDTALVAMAQEFAT